MGSKTFKKVAVPFIVVALGAAPAAATAAPQIDYSKNGATGQYQPEVVHKDYSKNGATGDFTPAANVSSAVAATPIAPQSSDDSFAWGAAALGAGLMLLAVVLVGMITTRVRRHRIASPTGPTTV
jgi:hypothetical protein